MNGPESAPALAGLRVASDPEPWRDAGFRVGRAVCRIGHVDLELCGRDAGEGLLGWSVGGLPAAATGAGAIDGVPTRTVGGGPGPPAPRHPNGALVLDHVVLGTPDLARTFAALESAGFELRRVREAGGEPPQRQGFFLMGDCILEVAGPAEPAGGAAAPAALWGLVVVVDDLEAAAARLGDRLGAPRDAVQPGRRIATVRAAAGLGLPVALMTPRPR